MSNQKTKVSELSPVNGPVDSDIFLMSSDRLDGKSSNTLNINTLRKALEFDEGTNTFPTIEEGLNSTLIGQFFNIPSDNTGYRVNQYVKISSSGYVPIVNEDGEPRTLLTMKGKDYLFNSVKDILGLTGSSKIPYANSTVADVLQRFLSLSDLGAIYEFTGNNPTADLQIAALTEGNDVLSKTGLYIGKRLRGIRRRGASLSVRSNQIGNNTFNPQITGVADCIGLSNYGSVDSVSTYFDIQSLPYESWEDLSDVTYGPNYFTTLNPDTYLNVQVGDTVKTKHSTPWFGLVTGKGTAGVILVDGWCNDKLTKTTPTNDFGCWVNSEGKLWVQNNNLLLNADGKATTGVIQENGIFNNINPNPTAINGIDNVVLGGLYPCTAAFLARGNSGKGWLVGYVSQGSLNTNFSSSQGVYRPLVGFHENSMGATGFRFSNSNTSYSMAWAGNSDLSNIAEGNLVRAISPKGQVVKRTKLLTIVSTNVSLNSLSPDIFVTGDNLTITLPNSSLVATGFTINFYTLTNNSLSFTTPDSKLIDGLATAIFYPRRRGMITVVWDGNQWQCWGDIDVVGRYTGTLAAFTVPANGTVTTNYTIAGSTVGNNVDVTHDVSLGSLLHSVNINAGNIATVVYFNPTATAIVVPAGNITLNAISK